MTKHLALAMGLGVLALATPDAQSKPPPPAKPTSSSLAAKSSPPISKSPAPKSSSPRKVAIVVYEGAELLDFAGPAEVLAAAGSFAGNSASALDIYLVARTAAPIKSQGFVQITPQYSIDNAPTPDFVVIPGGNSSRLSDDPAMMKWLDRVTSPTSTTEATLIVCTGAFPLAKLGRLDGLEVTTWYGAIDKLRAIAPKARVTDGRRFVDNGKIITTAGVSAGIDGALHLAARVFGRRIADQTARYMEYHWTPEPYLAKAYAYWNPSTDDRGRLLQQAKAALEEQRTAEAIAAFEKLAPGDPTGATWLALANARFHAKEYRRAIDAYVKVPATAAAYREAIYNLACAHAQLGNKPAAIAALQKALAAGISRDHALADDDLAPIREHIARL